MTEKADKKINGFIQLVEKFEKLLPKITKENEPLYNIKLNVESLLNVIKIEREQYLNSNHEKTFDDLKHRLDLILTKL